MKYKKIKMPFLKSFTLIETFVAISVLLVSLAGPLSIAATALKSAYVARDEITAFYLAQEGLEYVRAVRDENYLGQTPWLNIVDACINKYCNVDFPNFTRNNPYNTPGSVPNLYFGGNNLFNTQSGGTVSGFKRYVTILNVAGTADEVIVKVTVSWTTAGIPRAFTLSEHLFNWL